MARTFPTDTQQKPKFLQGCLLCADTNVRITSHDWHVQPFVKDQLAFRLSGAPSVRPIPPHFVRKAAKPYVLETRQSYRVQRSTVNPLRAQDFHLISTVRGASIQKGMQELQLAAGELFSCSSALLKCAAQVRCSSALLKCAAQVRCSSALLKCTA